MSSAFQPMRGAGGDAVHLGHGGSTTGSGASSDTNVSSAEPSLKLIIDLAKTAIYISKSFFNKLLLQLTCR